jgi:PAS domain S-box-containing protein
MDKIKKMSNTKFFKFFYNLFSREEQSENDFEENRKVQMLKIMYFFVIFFISIFCVLAFSYNITLAFAELFAVLLCLSVYIHFRTTKKYSFATYFIIALLGSFFLYIFSSGAVNKSGHVWTYIFPPAALYLLGLKKGSYAILLYFFISLILYLVGATIDYHPNFILRFYAAYFALFIVSLIFEQARVSMQQKIEIKNSELSDTVEKLESKDSALKETLKHYKTLFEASSEAVFVIHKRKIVDLNNTALKIFSCRKDDLLNADLSYFLYDKSEKNIKIMNDTLNEITAGDQRLFNWEFKKLNGEIFPSEVKINKTAISGKNRLLVHVRDISDQINAEKALIHAKEKAENSEKLKTDFLAQMSHEIRTPVNTILNYSSLISMEFEDQINEENKAYFESTKIASNRLLRTIDLILSISEIESGAYEATFEDVPIVEKIILPLVNEFKREALKENLLLKFNNELDNNISLHLDFYTFYQMMANLVHNAIKYTEKGTITIKLYQTKNSVALDVSDTGLGIAEEYIPFLFDKFSQERRGYNRKFEGSGLGLALVRKYCDINNADIKVKSIKGKGTTFTVLLNS